MASLMNGLSAMGAGVASYAGTAGLLAQKADLEQQQTVLADQLATVRESAGRVQAGDIAAAAAEKAQTFTGGENEKARQAEAARVAAQGQTARDVAGITANAPSDTMKLLKYLGINGDGTPVSGAASAAPAAPAGTTAPAEPSSQAASPASAAGPAAASPDLRDAILKKALGLPQPGSDVANRAAIAHDVENDPAFKYKTPGQKAAEIETRLAVGAGKLTDPASRESMAKAIASYQLAPLQNYALTKPGGPETMARAMEINPDYQESRYPEVNKVMSAFGSGKQGDTVRSINVGVQHLDVLDKAGQALANNNVQLLNSLKNSFQQQFGSPEPTTFDGLKQIVGTEIEKAVAGGIGASSDRDRLMASLKSANSPAQLQAITDGFRALMVGQLSGLKEQYEDGTGFKSGPFAFENKLVPATATALGGHAKNDGATPAPAIAPADPTAREVGKSYPLPNGKTGIWRGTGWELAP